MSHLDPFSSRRLQKVIVDFRTKNGQLPTRQDLAQAGFSDDHLDAAMKDQLIEQRYVTLTNGTILKGFVLK